MEMETCRICYSHENPFTNDSDLISPCACKGSLKYVHSTCLKHWRYKGSIFSEVKACEQCLTAYSAMAEEIKYRAAIILGATTSILLLYLFCILLFSSFFKLCMIIVEDIVVVEIEPSPYEYTSTNCYGYYVACGAFMLVGCKLVLNPSLFTIFNYIFTCWRILQFRFLVDKGLFLVFSFYFLKELFWAAYYKIDRLYFLVKTKRL
ncbi:hypothetical protein PAEPH01_1757 [Pancytospora epiphaga]|nr:hypothetical protein PAEPH01_1757 [Pancytospora epiphaga]